MTFTDEITEVSPSQRRLVREAEQRREAAFNAERWRIANQEARRINRRFIPRYTIAQLLWSVPECDWPSKRGLR